MDTLLKQKLIDNGYTEEFDLFSLVEACGGAFRRLTLHHNKVIKPNHIAKYGEGVKWQANPNQHVSKVPSQWGKTPEESIARLWLQLNKKS